MYNRVALGGRIGADLQITGRRDKEHKGIWNFNGSSRLRDDCSVDLKDLAAFAANWLNYYSVPTYIL